MHEATSFCGAASSGCICTPRSAKQTMVSRSIMPTGFASTAGATTFDHPRRPKTRRTRDMFQSLRGRGRRTSESVGTPCAGCGEGEFAPVACSTIWGFSTMRSTLPMRTTAQQSNCTERNSRSRISPRERAVDRRPYRNVTFEVRTAPRQDRRPRHQRSPRGESNAQAPVSRASSRGATRRFQGVRAVRRTGCRIAA